MKKTKKTTRKPKANGLAIVSRRLRGAQKIFEFDGFTEGFRLKDLERFPMARIRWEQQESELTLQVGEKKNWDDDVLVHVSVFIERVSKRNGG